MLEKSKTVMDILIRNGASELVAAGLAGNMAVESKLEPSTVNPRDNGAVAAGLVQWNDNYWSLRCMVENETVEYGHKKYKTKFKGESGANQVRELLKTRGLDYQCKFLVDSMKSNKYNDLKNVWKTMHAQTTPENVAEQFCRLYEKPDMASAHLKDRRSKAKEFYDNYKKQSKSKTSQPDKSITNGIYDALFDAVQKSLNSTSQACELKKQMYIDKSMFSDGIMMITQADGKTDKLPFVFDILLNGYYPCYQ